MAHRDELSRPPAKTCASRRERVGSVVVQRTCSAQCQCMQMIRARRLVRNTVRAAVAMHTDARDVREVGRDGDGSHRGGRIRRQGAHRWRRSSARAASGGRHGEQARPRKRVPVIAHAHADADDLKRAAPVGSPFATNLSVGTLHTDTAKNVLTRPACWDTGGASQDTR